MPEATLAISQDDQGNIFLEASVHHSDVRKHKDHIDMILQLDPESCRTLARSLVEAAALSDPQQHTA